MAKTDEFEEWFNDEYPLPPTVERGSVGRELKAACRKAYEAGSKALEDENEKLRNAIEGALRIKDLWLFQSEEEMYQGESEALATMLNTFEQALEK